MQTIAQLIERQSRERPGKTFVTFNGTQHSFADLHQRVRRTASRLWDTGIRPGDRVGLMLPNHPDHVFLYFALAWIGATVVEFSIFLKRSGLALQIEHCEPHFFIADAEYAPRLMPALQSAGSIRTILWRGNDTDLPGKGRALSAVLAKRSDVVVPGSSNLDRVHTISYTSGTTGEPKGAMLTDRYMQVGARTAGLLADVGADDVLLLWEPFYHLTGWMAALLCLQTGCSAGMVERFSGSQCWSQVRRFGVTSLHYLGGVMNILLKQPAYPDDRDNPVRVVWGAAAPATSWRAFERRFNVKIREGYGLSEAQNFTHLNLDGPIGSIGKPITEFDSWIEDERGLRLGPGEVGEIVVKAKELGITMSGYFKDPDKTTDVMKDGCIYTGDLGYRDELGYFYYSGRKKDSLRRRGENVSAWEVERVLNAHPAVEESAVIGVPSPMGEQDIKAFIKLSAPNGVAPLDLIKWCEQDLAYYQVPRFLSFVQDFPRGPTQRIRKTELPQSVEGLWDLEQSGYRIKR